MERIETFEQFMNESSKDVTKMPIIGKVTAKELSFGSTTFPEEEYDIVDTIEENGKTIYITNKWYKQGRVPLVIHEDLVKKFERY